MGTSGVAGAESKRTEIGGGSVGRVTAFPLGASAATFISAGRIATGRESTFDFNAVTPAMSDQLVRAVHWANGDDVVRAVVLTGAGERAFSAGSDISALDGYATPWDFRNRTDYCDALRGLPD